MLEPTRRFIDLLIRWRWPMLFLAAVLAAVSYNTSQQMTFNRSIENMFSERDPQLAPYRRLKQLFHSNEMLLAVYEDPDLLAPGGEGIKRVGQISERLRKIPGVRDVLSLAEINGLVAGVQRASNPLSIFDSKKTPLLDPENKLAAEYLKLFEGYTHSADGKLSSLAVMLDPAITPTPDNPDPQRRVVEQVRAVVNELPDGLAPGVVAGEPVMVVDGFQLVEDDGRRLGSWSTCLLGLTLAICFRSLRWLVVPLVIVQLTILWTQALLAATGLQLTFVSSMLAALVTVVGIATVMHLIVKYQELRAEGDNPVAALKESATYLAWPIVGALVTDALGFGSLWWSSVGPVYDFGTMMVIGSLLVAPALMLAVPGLALVGEPELEQPTISEDSWLRRGLKWLVARVAARPLFVTAIGLVIAVLSIIGSYKLQVETDFTRNFRPDSPLVKSYELVESRLGGAGVWDILLPAPPELDQKYLDRVLTLESQLRSLQVASSDGSSTEPALTKVISLADAIHAAEADPFLVKLSPELRASGMAAAMPNFVAALRTPGPDEQGQRWLRIMVRSRERIGAEEKKRVIADVLNLTNAAFPGTGGEPVPMVTGYHVLMTTLVDSLLRDQWAMFLLSCAGIALLMLVAFRSPTLALISLIPNAMPVLLVTGLMGWLGVRVNMGAAMIAAVSMGLSVDSSIHYITAFRRAIRQGKSVDQSLDEVQSSVGSAMVLSTVAIIAGFGVLWTSSFIPTVYFGALASLTMLGGLLGNLIILPLLLWWVTPHKPAGGESQK